MIPDKVDDLTNNGICTTCGQCCASLLPLTKDEITRLKDLAGTKTPHDIPVQADAATIDLTCPFLNSGKTENRCGIYNDRPTVCRNFTCHVGYPENMPEDVVPVNMWNLFGKSGIVNDGKDLIETLQDMGGDSKSMMPPTEVHMSTDRGIVKIKAYLGTATELVCEDDYILGILIDITPSYIYIVDNNTCSLEKIPFASVKAIRQGVVPQ